MAKKNRRKEAINKDRKIVKRKECLKECSNAPEEKVIIVEIRKPRRPNPFEGADYIYMTKNKIAVTKTTKSSAKRGYTKTTKTKYYEQNDRNMKQLKAAQGDTVRVGRKGKELRKI